MNYVFWIKGNLWAPYVLPMCCDMWLPGDYLTRYYSLCDIGILAPVFVMVISSGFVSEMNPGFMSAIVMWSWVRFSSLERCCYYSQCIVHNSWEHLEKVCAVSIYSSLSYYFWKGFCWIYLEISKLKTWFLNYYYHETCISPISINYATYWALSHPIIL